ncbi:hypothetical protein [Nonomuraea antimicrobica]|uniref:hypothetical protein n=1 Tax=Nonomuraea antimicrobica TaxID=561173 RepID=UPI0031E5A6E1
MFLRRAVAGLWLWLLRAAPWVGGNDRWELVAALRSVAYGEVVATGEREAWAFGWDILGIAAWVPVADGPHRPTAFRWDGGRWRKSDFPVELGDVGSVAASGPSNVWALAGGSVVRWDGRSWTVVRETPASALAVVADDDVWVFGDRRAWRFDGVTWSERDVPFSAFRVSARSGSDIWVLDGAAPWVYRFDGVGWAVVDLAGVLPQAPPPSDESPPGPADFRLSAITADPSGVWIIGEIGMSSFLVFQTGSGWRGEDTSVTAGRMVRGLAPVPDGVGGHWFAGSSDVDGSDSALARRDSSGRWSKVPCGGELTSLSAVAGGPLLVTGVIGGARGVFRGLV